MPPAQRDLHVWAFNKTPQMLARQVEKAGADAVVAFHEWRATR